MSLTSSLDQVKQDMQQCVFDYKEGQITIENLKGSNELLLQEIQLLKKRLEEMEASEREAPSPPATPELPVTQEERESHKKAKLAQLMTEFDPSTIISDKETQLQSTLSKLSEMDGSSTVPTDPLEIARQNRQLNESLAQLSEKEISIRELKEKLEAAEGKSAESSSRKRELEERLVALEEEYEQLLDQHIQEEEHHGDEELSQAVAEMKEKLEMQYRTRSEVIQQESEEMRRNLEEKASEMECLRKRVEELELVNSELAVSSSAPAVSLGEDKGDSVVLDEQVDRMRKSMSQQLSEFDTVKKRLVRDLQDRLEKIVDLEYSLSEARNQYKAVADGGKISHLEQALDEARKNVRFCTFLTFLV